jgi:tyrosyl-tRNA synthetase
LGIAYIIKDSGMTNSTGEAMRMIKQGAVKIDGEKITDTKMLIENNTTKVYQVGKRKFAKVTII